MGSGPSATDAANPVLQKAQAPFLSLSARDSSRNSSSRSSNNSSSSNKCSNKCKCNSKCKCNNKCKCNSKCSNSSKCNSSKCSSSNNNKCNRSSNNKCNHKCSSTSNHSNSSGGDSSLRSKIPVTVDTVEKLWYIHCFWRQCETINRNFVVVVCRLFQSFQQEQELS